MKAKTYFKSLSTAVIVMSVFLGLGAISLMERIVPVMDAMLEKNASVMIKANELVSLISQSENQNKIDIENQYWAVFEDFKKVDLADDKILLDELEELSKEYWSLSEGLPLGIKLIDKFSQISKHQLQEIEIKNKKAQQMGITSAWALGILLLISVGVQLLLRANILKFLIDPLEQLVNVLTAYNSGNKMRRCLPQKGTVDDIKQASYLVNKMLDKFGTTNNLAK